MMHEHDFDLIAAIAEGGMPPDQQSSAEASLASCQSCTADLQLQREALASLRAAPPVTMTDLERASLHRNLAAQLPPLLERPASRPAVPWFQRFMPAMAAAAALLVIVGVGSVLVDRGGDTDAASETTAIASESLRTAVDEELADATSGAALDDADVTTTTMAASAPAASMIQEYGSISSADLADIASKLVGLEETDGENTYSPDVLRAQSVDPALVCAETALTEGTISALGRATVDGDEVEIYRIDGLIKVYSIADCSLTASFD